jgi:hypothetical protein
MQLFGKPGLVGKLLRCIPASLAAVFVEGYLGGFF